MHMQVSEDKRQNCYNSLIHMQGSEDKRQNCYNSPIHFTRNSVITVLSPMIISTVHMCQLYISCPQVSIVNKVLSNILFSIVTNLSKNLVCYLFQILLE